MPEFGKLGQNLVVTGWVRTLRVQSTVTFIEVNDGSCLSNMQCVMDSDAEGYDQVDRVEAFNLICEVQTDKQKEDKQSKYYAVKLRSKSYQFYYEFCD
ncbi:hypothetical protein ACLB2K_040647 [Fragaria x ananassa]